MLVLYKLLVFICFMSVVLSVPVISAGISFGTPIYYQRPSSTYYERPYYHYSQTRYPSDYSYDHQYVSSGIGGFYGGSIGYSPLGF